MNRKTKFTLLSVFAALLLATNCSGGGSQNSSQLAALLGSANTTAPGGANITVSASALGIDDIKRVQLTVTGTGVTAPIIQDLVRNESLFQGVLLDIPVGTDRLFSVEAYDTSGAIIYTGSMANVVIEDDKTTLVALTLNSTDTPDAFGNTAPIINGITASTAFAQTGESVKLTVDAQDPDGDPLTYAWSTVANTGTFVDGDKSSATWIAPSTPGQFSITITVTDPKGASASLKFWLKVTAQKTGDADVRVTLNSSPTILNISIDNARLDRGDHAQLSATATDPDGDTLSYNWVTYCQGSMDSPIIAGPVFTVSDTASYGSCNLVLTVSDGKGGTNTGTLTIHIVPGGTDTLYPPELFEPFQQSLTVDPGKTLVFRIRGIDPEGKALTYAWSASAGSLSSSTETPVGTATQSEVIWTAATCGSDHVIRVTATDPDNMSTTYEFRPVEIAGAASCDPNPSRVSVASDGTQGNDASSQYSLGEYYSPYPSVSADGRYVVFSSHASNLVPGDTNGMTDIFLHDRQTKTTKRIFGNLGDDYEFQGSDNAVISADGRYVAFATWLKSPNTGSSTRSYVFIHNIQTGETNLASRAADGSIVDNHSYKASISADGRYVAYHSSATNIVPGVTDKFTKIFVYDQQTGETVLASVSATGLPQEPLTYTGHPALSANGQYITFTSSDSNLVPNDTNQKEDIYVHNLQTRETKLISRATDGTLGNNDSIHASISADGRYIMYESIADNLVMGDNNGVSDIFVHDQQTGETKRVSVAADGTEANKQTIGATICSNGIYAVFQSDATNLTANDTNNFSDVFRKNLQTGEVEQVSVAYDGQQLNSLSGSATISADGRFVSFISYATNLIPDDTNGKSDVFIRDLGN